MKRNSFRPVGLGRQYSYELSLLLFWSLQITVIRRVRHNVFTSAGLRTEVGFI